MVDMYVFSTNTVGSYSLHCVNSSRGSWGSMTHLDAGSREMHNVFDVLALAADDSADGLLRDVEIDHLQLLLGGELRVGATTTVR